MQLEVFKFKSPEEQQFNDIRTVEIDGEVWFIASDVTNILGYSNGRDAVARHCKPKGVVKHDIPTQSGKDSEGVRRDGDEKRGVKTCLCQKYDGRISTPCGENLFLIFGAVKSVSKPSFFF